MSSRFHEAGVLVTLFLLGIACSQDWGNSHLPEPGDGERWEYNLELMAPLMGVLSGKMVVRVDGTETIGGQDYWKLVTVVSGIPGMEPEVSYARWTSEGVFGIDGKYLDRPEVLEYPYPFDVGRTWTVQGPEEQTTYRVEAIETLETIDRTYDGCLKLSYTLVRGGARREGTQYYARGIGLVKETQTSASEGLTVEIVLEKHER